VIGRERGQVLPLFALFLVALCAFAAIAIDVSGAYSARRAYRAFADAASLAGAQDLQLAGSRAVDGTARIKARTHAMDSVLSQLGVTGALPGACATTADADVPDSCVLPGTSFHVSIKAGVYSGQPAPIVCQSCDPERSVQVGLRNANYGLSFARVLGQSSWNVGVTSVAGMAFSRSYAIVMLRPPTSTAVSGVRDIAVAGGTTVNVFKGDVATNANMVYNGSDSLVVLDAGYGMYFYDPANPPFWGSNPVGKRITSLVDDPVYPIPSRGLTPPAGVVDSDATRCGSIAASILANPKYAPSVPVLGSGLADMSKVACYLPGVYPAGGGGDALAVSNGSLAILEPGLYFFDGLLDSQGSVIGGYTPASPGVALVFRESQDTQFKNRTSGGSSGLTQIVALNAGDKFLNSSGREATAALDYGGNPVQTNTSPPKLMTIIVPPDARCPVAIPLPASCSNAVENHNKAIDLSGGSALYLAGVQYAPSDNMSIAGNTVTGGYIGQVWGWTVQYQSSVINQEGDQTVKAGTLRLDAACTVPRPMSVCVP
jgi:hypothetical protein